MLLKRFLIVLMSVFFCIALSQTASAQSPDLPIVESPAVVIATEAAALPSLATPTISMTLTATPGQEITVPVLIGDVTGLGITSIQGNITVAPNILYLKGVSYSATTVVQPELHNENHLLPGIGMFFAAIATNPWKGSGALLLIPLKVTGKPGESSLIMLGNLTLNEREFPMILGKVTIVAPPPVVSGRAYYRGDTNRPVPNVAYRLGSPVRDYTVVSPSGSFSFVVEPETYRLYSSKVNDQNGAITAYDAALTLRCVVGLESCDMLSADAYQDGQLTAYDAGLILRYSIGVEDATRLSSTGGWVRNDANQHPFLINSDTTLNVSYMLIGDVSGNWGAAPVVAASEDSTDVTVEDGQLVIQSNQQFLSVEIAVEGDPVPVSVQNWTFERAGDKLGGFTAYPTTLLSIPMDGHITSVRLDERESIAVDLWIDPQQVPVFLPLVGQ